MSSASDRALRLRDRAAEFTRQDPERLVDEDGDVQQCDSPFGIWARLARGRPETSLVLVAAPLLEVLARPGLEAEVASCIPGTTIAWKLGQGSIQLFEPVSMDLLDSQETFARAVSALRDVGTALVAAVQPRFGGLTAEQQRVLRGWRGHDPRVDADMNAIAAETGATVLRHGWDPETESAPLLVVEETGSAWANRFVTMENGGAIRFRSTVRERCNGVPGFSLTIVRLDTAAAGIWARGLGLEPRGQTLEEQDVRHLAGRSWDALTASLAELPHQRGQGWEPARAG